MIHSHLFLHIASQGLASVSLIAASVAGHVRRFCREDIPQVIDLNLKLFSGSGSLSREVQSRTFNDVCFQNPWHDPEISSLVYEQDGRIAGFLGIVPRQMSLNGQTVRVAVGQHLMVDNVPLASLQLFRTFMSGPQDLSIADMAVDVTRRIWERLGGSTSISQSVFWKKPLRLATAALSYLTRNSPQSPLFDLVRPFSRGLDGMLRLIPQKAFRHPVPQAQGEELSVEQMVSLMPEVFNGRDLIPVYSERSLLWLFEILQREKRFGVFRKCLVRSDKGLGWYMYNLVKNGKSSVIQIAGTPQSLPLVMEHLFYDAWKNGSYEIWGRLDPRHKRIFTQQYCVISPAKNWVLVHARRPELIKAINDGNAFLTRLEGDLWFF